MGDDPVEILFSANGGITVIKGNNQDVSGKSSNGSGKSTIIEAIFFGLTGSTLRKLNLDGIIHNAKGGDCLVEIEFDDIKIVRTITAKSSKGGAKLYVGGVEQTTASIKETNKLIDTRVGINFETLSNILIFGQHNIVSFLDAGEKEKREIIENLMNLREYNEYEQTARDLLKEAKSTLKRVTEKHTIQSRHLLDQIALQQKQSDELGRFVANLKTDISIIDARIAATPNLDDLRGMWQQYAAYMDARNKLEARIHELIQERNQHQSEYNEAVAAKQADSLNKQPLLDALNQIKAKSLVLEERKRQLWQEMVHPLEAKVGEAQIASAKAQDDMEAVIAAIKPSEDWDFQIASIQKLIDQQKSRVDDIQNKAIKSNETCPTCYGVVDGENAYKIIKAIENEIAGLTLQQTEVQAKQKADAARMAKERSAIAAQLDGTLEADHEEINSLIDELNEAKEKVKTQYFGAKEKLDGMVAAAQKEVDYFDESLINRHDPKITTIQAHITNATGYIAKAQTALKSLAPVEQPKLAVEEIGKLEAQLESDKKLRAEKEHQIENNPYIGVIQSMQGGIDALKLEVDSITQEIKGVEAKMPYYDFWVAHMGKEGIKSFVIDQIVPTLNQQIDYWMQLIYQGAISVKFDKYFNVSMINNSTKNEMIFGQGSGGERRRIDIAIMLAFRQVMKMSTGKDPNILFFDEVAENLDEEGVYRLYEAMQDIAKTNHLYIITHNPSLLHLLQSCPTINVTKKDGSMKIV